MRASQLLPLCILRKIRISRKKQTHFIAILVIPIIYILELFLNHHLSNALNAIKVALRGDFSKVGKYQRLTLQCDAERGGDSAWQWFQSVCLWTIQNRTIQQQKHHFRQYKMCGLWRIPCCWCRRARVCAPLSFSMIAKSTCPMISLIFHDCIIQDYLRKSGFFLPNLKTTKREKKLIDLRLY